MPRRPQRLFSAVQRLRESVTYDRALEAGTPVGAATRIASGVKEALVTAQISMIAIMFNRQFAGN